ncbi:glycosyltransferase family 32 protein [Acidocella sp.]|uniref:glycosyltransferase family 32 protein n=1 Tax=Acidocella sp. TaxID=50710 RepID=UPI002618DDF3|nr:glycosyltransferase [Acidocella sp.]
MLYLTPDGKFRHTKPTVTGANLFCNENGELLVDGKTFEVVRLGPARSVGLRTEKGFLCAIPEGRIEYRSQCLIWEIFTLLSLDELRNALHASPQSFSRKPRDFYIPKTIHQTSFSENVPKEVSKNVDLLKELNPDWTYRYWCDKSCHDFIYQYYGWDILKQYLRINPRYGAARADLFRYLLIYQFGGVYLDIKSGSTAPFDNIIKPEDQFLLSHWRNSEDDPFPGAGLHSELSFIPRGEFQNWHIIAAAGHPLLERAINFVLTNISRYQAALSGVGTLAVLRLTGPIAYTLAIYPELCLYSHRIFDALDAGLLYQAVSHRPQRKSDHYSKQDTPIIL